MFDLTLISKITIIDTPGVLNGYDYFKQMTNIILN